MTVTGLSTVNLSSLTVWQQVILYILMTIGDITVVSWIMVLVRKHYFRQKCEWAVRTRKRRRLGLYERSKTLFMDTISSPSNARPFHKERDEAHELDAPMFNVTQATSGATLVNPDALKDELARVHADPSSYPIKAHEDHSDSLTDGAFFSSSPLSASIDLPRSPVTTHRGVAFAASTSITPSAYQRTLHRAREGIPAAKRRPTVLAHKAQMDGSPSTKHIGDGSFAGPVTLADRLLRRAAPSAYRNVKRKFTIPYTTTLNGVDTQEEELRGVPSKAVSWLKFDGLQVNRNSDFQTDTLTDDQLEQIGGAEYRALRLLSYLVPAYFVGTQLISYVLFAPWLSSVTNYDAVFAAQPREVNKPWFAFFQVMGAYTGGGLSLVDMGMVPFQGATLMVIAMIFVILAGNHALPIFLRFIIWLGTKAFRRGTEAHQAFSFLLDHPRRCFIYLFPSHQTWFLVACLLAFSALEWACFSFLNIGLEVYDSIPSGTKALVGLFQGLAARASGFPIVSLASFAPALQFLYVVMMYIAVYPVAMSIRATNVYEERSLGVFEAPPDDEDEEPDDLHKLAPRQAAAKYIGWHVRRQVSVDIWWLVWGVFLCAVIERDNLMNENMKWFDLFRVLFELVSAFGGIGLSLGFPSNNFSFAGAMKPLSKVVIIVIMVRGRHRGLPVAVDRAVLLPHELVTTRSDGQSKGDPSSDPTAQRPDHTYYA